MVFPNKRLSKRKMTQKAKLQFTMPNLQMTTTV